MSERARFVQETHVNEERIKIQEDLTPMIPGTLKTVEMAEHKVHWHPLGKDCVYYSYEDVISWENRSIKYPPVAMSRCNNN